MNRSLNLFYLIATTASLVGLLAATGYAWTNQSGHSGIDPSIAPFLFAPACLLGLAGTFSHGASRRHAAALAIIGLEGALFGWFVTGLGILNSYEKWIAAGMPDRNPHAGFLLLAFLLVAIAAAAVAVRLIPSKTAEDSTSPLTEPPNR